jgi:glycosyltransferase involved in cell wall biosynthesis
VVDDGSTDETPDVLTKYRDGIRVLRQANRGVSAARNLGAASAGSDFLAFLDADDFWQPTKLADQALLFAREPELGLVHCGMQEIDSTGAALRERLDGMAGTVAHDMLLFRRSVILGAGSTALVPRRVFTELGGFDSQLSTSADWDFCFRVALRYRVGFVPKALACYRIHQSAMHMNIGRMESDMMYAYRKAFANGGADLDRLKRRSYGDLHRVLAGSYFTTRQYRPFLRHAWQSVLLTPENMLYFLSAFARNLRRGLGMGANPVVD